MAADPSRLVLTEGEFTPEEILAAQDEPIILSPQDPEIRQWIAPHFIWALREELATRLCGDAETCPELERGGLRIISSLDVEVQQIGREVGRRGACSCPSRRIRAAYAEEIGVPYERWMRQPRGPRGQQRRADRDRLPDRRGHRLHRQRRLLPRRGRDAAVPAPVRRARRRLAPAGIGVQAVQLRDRHQRRHDDRRLDVHGRHDDLRRLERLHAQELRPARARPDSDAQLAPVVAQHPGRQGAGRSTARSTCSTWRAASG